MSMNMACLFYLIILVTYKILKVKVFRYNRYVNIACIFLKKRQKLLVKSKMGMVVFTGKIGRGDS